ncbi:hypothetical protein AgCh_032770 [Apium graveolens]
MGLAVGASQTVLAFVFFLFDSKVCQILDKEAVKEVKAQREIYEIKPSYIIQLKVETTENKRRISTLKGIVIARRNAGQTKKTDNKN